MSPRLDPGDSLHAGSQCVVVLVEARLDTEEVAPSLGNRYRRDLSNLEGKSCSGQGRERERTAPAWVDMGDVALVDLDDDAISVDGRDLVEHIAFLDRCSQGLAEIATNDDAIEGRHELGSGQLFIEQGDLSTCFVEPSLYDATLGAIVERDGAAILVAELIRSGFPPPTLRPSDGVASTCLRSAARPSCGVA